MAGKQMHSKYLKLACSLPALLLLSNNWTQPRLSWTTLLYDTAAISLSSLLYNCLHQSVSSRKNRKAWWGIRAKKADKAKWIAVCWGDFSEYFYDDNFLKNICALFSCAWHFYILVIHSIIFSFFFFLIEQLRFVQLDHSWTWWSLCFSWASQMAQW